MSGMEGAVRLFPNTLICYTVVLEGREFEGCRLQAAGG